MVSGGRRWWSGAALTTDTIPAIITIAARNWPACRPEEKPWSCGTTATTYPVAESSLPADRLNLPLRIWIPLHRLYCFLTLRVSMDGLPKAGHPCLAGTTASLPATPVDYVASRATYPQ